MRGGRLEVILVDIDLGIAKISGSNQHIFTQNVISTPQYYSIFYVYHAQRHCQSTVLNQYMQFERNFVEKIVLVGDDEHFDPFWQNHILDITLQSRGAKRRGNGR